MIRNSPHRWWRGLAIAAGRVTLGAGFGAMLAMSVAAVEPREQLSDPALEARARAISKDLRCLVCQNQSIDDSNADIARDLRRLVRERLIAGDSDAAIRDYLVARYGDFVLLDPPVKPVTYLLWGGPVLILCGAVAGAAFLIRRQRKGAEAAPLSADERRKLDAIMSEREQ
jgi:cytochrome c-type biogenesis protein CcmH